MNRLLLTGIAALFSTTGIVHAGDVAISGGRTAGKWELSITSRGECVLEKLYSECPSENILNPLNPL